MNNSNILFRWALIGCAFLILGCLTNGGIFIVLAVVCIGIGIVAVNKNLKGR